MDLLARGVHVGLVGDVNVEGLAREGRDAMEEEEDGIARAYHRTTMSGKLRQAVCWATNR